MADLSYFQKYSQRENHITNNTVLMIRHLYRVSPQKVNDLLKQLVGLTDDLVGLTFKQQVRTPHSIPDAQIEQSSLRIYIETKRGGTLDPDQIVRHLKSLTGDSASTNGIRVLIGLTSDRISDASLDRFRKEANSVSAIFANITFAELLSALNEFCEDYEQDLSEVIRDYEAFLLSEGLLAKPYAWMVAFPCGTSW